MEDIGVFPLLFVLPFMYLPRVIDGDTQPWVISASAIAFLTFRTREFINIRDMGLIIISVLCLIVYAARGNSDFLLIRTAYMHVSFWLLWLTCSREKGDLFPSAIRYTVVLWFAVGAYEFLNVSMGHGLGMPELFTGRFGAGRSGVPGLTAEPSFYGSLSALQMMYLLSENDSKNRVYIAMSAMSVVLSGSLLAALLLVFPFFRLSWRWKLLSLATVPVMAVMSFLVSAGGIISRLSFLQAGNAINSMSGSLFEKLLLDPSLNIRVGNIYYTLYYHFWESLSLSTPIEYMLEYSKFCRDQGIWWDPITEYTIPSAGELVYGSGIFGLLLIIGIIVVAQAQETTWKGRMEKAAFILACFLNPITIANPFLSIYALKRPKPAEPELSCDRSAGRANWPDGSESP